MDDDPAPMSAEESLSLIAQQNRRMRRELGGGPARMLAAWALAWLLGWGLTYLGAIGVVPVPGWVPGVVVAVLFVVAITYTAYVSTRAGRGIRGPSKLVGAMYGWSWALGAAGLMVVDIRITNFGVLAASLPQVIFSLGTAPE